jgi:hypothetical protein
MKQEIFPWEIEQLPTNKVCVNCGEDKNRDEFYTRRIDEKLSLSSYCKICAKERHKLVAKIRTPEQKKFDQVKTKYNMTPKEYYELMALQEGRCLICGRASKKLVVDHDHKLNRVRALLCQKCNHGLGMFKDDPKLLLSAAGYLTKFQEAINAA